MTNTKRSLWPYGIIGALLVFAIFIVSVAVYISRKNVDLESKEYYLESVAYDDIIEMKKAFEALDEKPKINTESKGRIVINFPVSYWSKIDSGRLNFFRPDDASLDFESKFNKPLASSLSLLIGEKRSGAWKMKFQFHMEGKSYFTEEELYID
jgi:hypothetical protein